eukprot:Awhi_evm1s11025
MQQKVVKPVTKEDIVETDLVKDYFQNPKFLMLLLLALSFSFVPQMVNFAFPNASVGEKVRFENVLTQFLQGSFFVLAFTFGYERFSVKRSNIDKKAALLAQEKQK